MRNIPALCPTALILVNDYGSRGIIICFNENRSNIPKKVLFQKTHIDSNCILKLCMCENILFLWKISLLTLFRDLTLL